MLTFTEFLADAARRGEVVNTVFEERLFEMVGLLGRLTGPLSAAGVRHEIVGGLAVLIHVEEADPGQSVLTRDVDLMIDRRDLERASEAAAQHGFQYRHTAGMDRLLPEGGVKARNAVRLVFSQERVKPTQAIPNPALRPERKTIQGQEVYVIPPRDLLVMKLGAYQGKDRVHIRSMDAAGLITPEVERELSADLLERLRHVRETE